MKTNWLTIERIKAAAGQDEIAAVACSLLHHQQGRDADWVDLKEAIEECVFNMSPNLCACCKKFLCRDCPLYPDEIITGSSNCCGGLLGISDDAFLKLRKDYSNANFKAFQEAEAEICKYIENVIAGQKKPKDTPAFRLCDKCKRVVDDGLSFCPGHPEQETVK